MLVNQMNGPVNEIWASGESVDLRMIFIGASYGGLHFSKLNYISHGRKLLFSISEHQKLTYHR